LYNTRNIEYILDEVITRGVNDNPSECNDFAVLFQRKDFKELIALELYELYFWDERHEFDLQLLREIVDSVGAFFNEPDTVMEIKSGFLQTLPSAIVVTLVAFIWSKLKTIPKNMKKSDAENSSWVRIKKNIKQIDAELSRRDYILTDEIERLFDASREEILPLLKLCGCKCYIEKKRSIWLRAGLPISKVDEILKKHRFSRRR
jgi:hypothetical protein